MSTSSILCSRTVSIETLYHTIPLEKGFENIVGKGENAGKPAFSLFPTMFLPISKRIPVFE